MTVKVTLLCLPSILYVARKLLRFITFVETSQYLRGANNIVSFACIAIVTFFAISTFGNTSLFQNVKLTT